MTRYFIVSFLIIFFALNVHGQTNPCEKLIFKTGFEPNTEEVLDGTGNRATDFMGLDNSTGFDWTDDLRADDRTFFMNYVDVTDGTNPEMLGANLAVDPDDETNTVLLTWQKDAEKQSGGYWSRVQGEIRNADFYEAYYKIRIRFDSSMAVINDNDWWIWGMLFEFKPNSDHSLSPRIIRDSETNQLVWGTHIRVNATGVNKAINTKVPIKFNTWQVMEFYGKAGDQDTGRYWLKIDGETLIDETTTTATNNTLWSIIQVFKVYGEMVHVLTDPSMGNKPSFNVWYDDFELWATSAGSLSAPTDLQAVPVSENQIDLSWTDNSDTEDGYRIERKTGDGNFSLINIVSADVTSYSNTFLSPGTTYSYRVFGYDNVLGNSAYSNVATATTQTQSTTDLNFREEQGLNVNIYPSPVYKDEILTIRYNSESLINSEDIFLEIYNIAGGKTYSNTFPVDFNKKGTINIPVKDIGGSGKYIARLKCDKLFTKKLFVVI